jgi:hypothetical protein
MKTDVLYYLKSDTFRALVGVMKEHRAKESKKLESAESVDDMRKAQGAIAAIDRIINLPEHYEQKAAEEKSMEYEDDEYE